VREFFCLFSKRSLPITLIGPVCVCVWVGIRTITVEQTDLSPRYLARRFILMVSRSCSKIKVIGQSSLSQEENVADAIGATANDGFLG